jgi:hypothetical protein
MHSEIENKDKHFNSKKLIKLCVGEMTLPYIERLQIKKRHHWPFEKTLLTLESSLPSGPFLVLYLMVCRFEVQLEVLRSLQLIE